jgi:hypothetical protein
MKRVLAVLICAFLFTPLLSAREEPRTRAAQERRALRVLEDQIFLKRSCDAPKNGVTHRFGNLGFLKEAASCSGECDCETCSCSGTLSCCMGGCGACWEFLDDEGYCGGVSVE